MHQTRRGCRLLMLTNCFGWADAALLPSSKDACLALCFITAPCVSGSRKTPHIKCDISSNYLYKDGRPDRRSGPSWKVMALPARRAWASWLRWPISPTTRDLNDPVTWLIAKLNALSVICRRAEVSRISALSVFMHSLGGCSATPLVMTPLMENKTASLGSVMVKPHITDSLNSSWLTHSSAPF